MLVLDRVSDRVVWKIAFWVRESGQVWVVTVCFYFDFSSLWGGGGTRERRDLYDQRSKKFWSGGSIKEIYDSANAGGRKWQSGESSDLYARSSLCVSMLLNLGKRTFRSSYRMHLNAVESIWQENIKAHLIYGSLFRVWFDRVWEISLKPLTIVVLSIVLRLQRKKCLQAEFLRPRDQSVCSTNWNRGKRDHELRWRVNLCGSHVWLKMKSRGKVDFSFLNPKVNKKETRCYG